MNALARKQQRTILRSEATRIAQKTTAIAIALTPLMLPLALTLISNEAAAQQEVWTRTANSVVDQINAILRPVSLVAIIGLGLGAGFGRVEWGTVGKIFAGLVVANGASTIYGYITTNGGGSGL